MTAGSIDSVSSLRNTGTRPLPALRNASLREVIGPALIAPVFALLIAWSWQRWMEPVIDFGRELYVPWQVSQGRTLGTDLITCYGPLSHLFNGFIFWLFGASVQTLVWTNIVVLGAATAVLYAIMRELGSRVSATLGAIMFLAIFGTGHLMYWGNFNFITPYSHEMTHGFTIALVGLYCFLRYTRSNDERWVVGMGLSMGLVFMTKPEVFVALAGALAPGLACLFWSRRHLAHGSDPMRRAGGPGRVLLTLAGAACIPIVLVALILAIRAPWSAALREVMGAWALMVNSKIVGHAFYANSTGLENPMEGFRWIFWEFSFFALMLAPGVLTAIVLRDGGVSRRVLGMLIGVGAAAISNYFVQKWAWAWGWKVAGALLMLGMILLALPHGILLVRKWHNGARRQRLIARLAAIAFGTLMMLKMFLHTRFEQYGFVLGVMATMLLVVALVDWVPHALEACGRRGSALRGSAIVVLGLLTLASLRESCKWMGEEKFRVVPEVAGEADAFWVNDRGPILQDMTDFIHHTATSGQTLTVLPEGAILNFLSRRGSPSPYASFTPPELLMFGEDRMYDSIKTARPDFVAIVHRLTDDLGPARFGIDYGVSMRDWLMSNYHPIHLSGELPFSTDKFGILLLQRNDPARKRIVPASAQDFP